MAHYTKFSAGSIGHMLGHYDRSKTGLGENIDKERSELNYNLAPDHQMSQIEFIHQRLSEVKVQKRADVNILCDWIVTLPTRTQDEWKEDQEGNWSLEKLPQPYTEQESKEFFQAAYEFMIEKYGEKNVVSAYVHRDESQDHIHFAWLPIVQDKKWNEKHPDKPREKLSAKECVTQEHLKTFHQELQLHLDERFGQDYFQMLNGATIGGNLSIEELRATKKLEDLSNRFSEAESDITNQQKKLESVRTAIKTASQQLETLKTNISSLEAEKTLKTAEISSKNDEIKKLDDKIEEFQSKISKNEDILADISESIDAAVVVLESKTQNISSSKQMTMDESRELIRRVRIEQKSAVLEKSAFQFLQDVIFNAFPQAKIWWENWQRGIGRFKQKQKLKDDPVR